MRVEQYRYDRIHAVAYISLLIIGTLGMGSMIYIRSQHAETKVVAGVIMLAVDSILTIRIVDYLKTFVTVTDKELSVESLRNRYVIPWSEVLRVRVRSFTIGDGAVGDLGHNYKIEFVGMDAVERRLKVLNFLIRLSDGREGADDLVSAISDHVGRDKVAVDNGTERKPFKIVLLIVMIAVLAYGLISLLRDSR